jgi:hypothetical protein
MRSSMSWPRAPDRRSSPWARRQLEIEQPPYP